MKKSVLSLIILPIFMVGCNTTSTKETMESEASLPPEAQSDSTSDNAMTQTSEPVQTYTLAEVAQHATADDCWMVIEGKVYDITPQITAGTHPGGEANIRGCGKDATEMFNNRPNGSGSHSEQARSYLPNFYVGELAE